MKLDARTILLKSATMLNKHELSLYIDDGFSSSFTSTEEDLEYEYDTLLFCLLEAYSEVASDYHPLYHTQNIVVSNDKFDLSTLTKRFKSIKHILDSAGNEISDYDIEYNYLKIKSGNYTIKYRYLPSMLEVYNDDMQDFDGKVSESLMCYGTCAYYCLKYNISDSYDLWDAKFKQSLLISMQKTDNLIIKARKFL